MKRCHPDKLKRRIVYHGWRRHIGSNKKIQFEAGRKKMKPDVINKESWIFGI